MFQFEFYFNVGQRAVGNIFPFRFPMLGSHGIDEIRGFRGVKFHGPRNRSQYEIIVDSPDLTSLFINIDFKRRQTFHTDILTQSLREAAGVAREVIPESEWGDQRATE